MKTALLFLLAILVTSSLGLAQIIPYLPPSQWEHYGLVAPPDPVTLIAETFTLRGAYITAPRGNTAEDFPRIQVNCVRGRLVSVVGLIRTPVPWPSTIVETVANGKMTQSVSDTTATRDPNITFEGTGRAFSTFDITWQWDELLKAPSVIVLVNAGTLGNLWGRPVMMFIIPAGSDKATACN